MKPIASFQEYSDQAFDKLEQTHQVFDRIHFEACRFSQCDFSICEFKRCQFIDCEFMQCNLSNLKVPMCSFSEVVFDESKLIGINWTEAKWPQIKLTCPIKFYRSNISQSSFFGLSLVDGVFEECKAHEVDFREVEFNHASLVYTDFENSQFMHTKLNKADFTEAINYNIDLELNDIKGAKFSFPEVVSLLNCLDIKISGLGID